MEDQDTAAPLEGATQETQEEESNIIRGNRIGSRFTRNLVEDEEFEIVVNLKQVQVRMVLILVCDMGRSYCITIISNNCCRW